MVTQPFGMQRRASLPTDKELRQPWVTAAAVSPGTPAKSEYARWLGIEAVGIVAFIAASLPPGATGAANRSDYRSFVCIAASLLLAVYSSYRLCSRELSEIGAKKIRQSRCIPFMAVALSLLAVSLVVPAVLTPILQKTRLLCRVFETTAPVMRLNRALVEIVTEQGARVPNTLLFCWQWLQWMGINICAEIWPRFRNVLSCAFTSVLLFVEKVKLMFSNSGNFANGAAWLEENFPPGSPASDALEASRDFLCMAGAVSKLAILAVATRLSSLWGSIDFGKLGRFLGHLYYVVWWRAFYVLPAKPLFFTAISGVWRLFVLLTTVIRAIAEVLVTYMAKGDQVQTCLAVTAGLSLWVFSTTFRLARTSALGSFRTRLEVVGAVALVLLASGPMLPGILEQLSEDLGILGGAQSASICELMRTSAAEMRTVSSKSLGWAYLTGGALCVLIDSVVSLTLNHAFPAKQQHRASPNHPRHFPKGLPPSFPPIPQNEVERFEVVPDMSSRPLPSFDACGESLCRQRIGEGPPRMVNRLPSRALASMSSKSGTFDGCNESEVRATVTSPKFRAAVADTREHITKYSQPSVIGKRNSQCSNFGSVSNFDGCNESETRAAVTRVTNHLTQPCGESMGTRGSRA